MSLKKTQPHKQFQKTCATTQSNTEPPKGMPKNFLSRAQQTGIFVCISELRKAMFLHSEKST